MIYIVLMFSLLFECAFTNLVSINSILIPLFFIISLSILYPYFKKEKYNFLIVCIVCGLIYDILFYNSVFVSTISFFVCGIIIMLLYNYLTYNICNANIINTIIIIIYRTISYFLLFVIDYINFDIFMLLEGIYSSLIVNIIYGVIIYIIINLVSKKLKIRI